jgi:1,4-alpha-glucan branching enzyme
MVRFVLEARGARQVTVAGDFNGWDPARTPLEGPDLGGNFVATVPVTPGEHEYMFVVDGRWVTDPAAAERRADGFGRENALLRL